MSKSETIGQYRVGVSFNPSANPLVDEIKTKAAELIDLCHDKLPAPDGETGRLWSLAMTNFEDGAMWAVKAATKKRKEP